MARVEWGHNGRCSYKRTTLIVCSVNIVVALYVLHSLYISLYMYPLTDSENTFRYSADQIKKMKVSNEIRKASEPKELIKVVARFEKLMLRENKVVELPPHIIKKIIDEILDRLRSLGTSANATERQDAVVRALSTDWPELAEDIGLWIPLEVVNKEHDDKPDGEEEFESEILPGRQLPPECHTELHTDYDGAAVRWGLTNPKESAYDCCMACINQAKLAKPGEMKCNIWVYCPSETGCNSQISC